VADLLCAGDVGHRCDHYDDSEEQLQDHTGIPGCVNQFCPRIIGNSVARSCGCDIGRPR
jgi:hypothetical protein